MEEKRIDKHYQISKSLLEDLKAVSKGNFKSEVRAIEHYLKIGLKYQAIKDSESVMMKDISYCKGEIFYIKKLLEQLFSNKKFVCNRPIKDDQALKDFKKELYKDNFYE